MRRIRTWWRSIPRPVRILRNVLLLAILIFAVYLFRDCPDLTVEQAYRREVNSELVEPGEILGIIELDAPNIDRLLIVEGESSVQLLGYEEDSIGFFGRSNGTRLLCHRGKGERVTLMVAPFRWLWSQSRYSDLDIPVILFDDVPNAVRAELDLKLSTGGLNGTGQLCEYHLETRRKQGGFFEFRIGDRDDDTVISDEDYMALSNLCDLFLDDKSWSAQQHFAEVRLYDQNDRLILEEELTLRSLAAEAHAEREREGA